MFRNLVCLLLVLSCCAVIVGIDISYASVIEIADNSEKVGTHNDIALDSNGFAHVCYAEGGGFHFNSTDALKYATNKSGSWVSSVVDNSANVGGYSSVTVDANDKIHISYYDYTNKDLKYATNKDGSWDVQTLLSAGDVGQFTAIDINSAGAILILYQDKTTGTLNIISNETGNWETSSVDNVGVWAFSDMIIDSEDYVHLSYVKSDDLYYATNISGDWVSTMLDENIANSSNLAQYTSIALDSNKKIYISYFDWGYEQYLYATKYITNKTGEWLVTPIVARNSYTGVFTNIALDSNDKIHFSYYDYAEETNYHLTNESGEWIYTIIESFGDTVNAGFGYNSLAVGSDNTPHIAYYDYIYAERNLNYVHLKSSLFDASGSWYFKTTGNWVDDPSKCVGDPDETGSGTLEQNEYSVTGVFGDIEFEGNVSADGYELFGFDDKPFTRIHITLTATSNSNSTGIVTTEWFTGSVNCKGGSNITLTRTGSSGGTDSSGGGSGGCFISNLNN